MKFIKPNAPSTEQEQHLIAEYRRSGDLQVLGKIYEVYMPLVYGLSLRYFRDEEQSKDAVMQIFEQLISKLKIHDVTNFKSWLYTLTRNYCLMALRSSGKHEFIPVDDNTLMENSAFTHPDVDESKEQKLSLMEKCIETLQAEQRSTIQLFYLEQKCYKEVADITGYDLNKVKSYIQNGKRNLKICMEKNND